MEVKEYKGDLLQSGADYICHQVNCLGVMGGGIAKQIRMKYPVCYSRYSSLCEEHKPEELLGKIQLCPEDSTIVNIFGQLDFGTDKRYTDYDALRKAFSIVARVVNGKKARVGFPKYFGCGLAGGDWNIVSDLIVNAFKDTDAIIEFWEF